MRTAKQILDSLHPADRDAIEREFALQREKLCAACPLQELAGDQTAAQARPTVAESPAPGYEAGTQGATEAPARCRILWVDDDIVVHAVAKKFLHEPGLELHLASSGYEALELLNEHRYDLMITDIGMPGMTGWQLTAKIKGKYPRMQVAVLTGLNYDIGRQVMDQHGIRYFLRKPITREDTKGLIEQVLSNRQGPA